MTLMTSTTVRKARAGLLPLYLELYDQRLPEMRRVLDPFLAQVVSGLSAQGIPRTAARPKTVMGLRTARWVPR